MTKAKTNALDALRTLIAERQQYEQWITALDSRREGTPEHVFERVHADYQTRLERVVTDIRGHAEELQLSISTLSSRLVEVAREEDTRREGLQEAELRAAVGEYEPQQWEQLRTDAEREIAKIAADRESLDNQLGELRAIQKLSEVGSVGTPPGGESPSTSPVEEVKAATPETPAAGATASPPATQSASPAAASSQDSTPSSQGGSDAAAAGAPTGHRSGTSAATAQSNATRPPVTPAVTPKAAESTAPSRPAEDAKPSGDQARPELDSVAAAATSAAATTSRDRSMRTPPTGSPAAKGRSDAAKPDGAKTLKCPECGTPNYPTEWYCERCGGELATM